MLRIDPHTHSTCSDGTDSPAQLLRVASGAGLDMVGLTDHDTFAGWDEAAAEVPSSGVALLRGVEISCAADRITVHLLAYLPDPTNAPLLECFERARRSRETRAQAITELLSEDYPITWEDVLVRAPQGGPIGRPHIADALVAAGCFEKREEAFASVLHPSGPYYVHHWAPDSVDAVGLVLDAGGVPVLAHPKARQRQHLLPDQVIADMKDAGLFGIERDHRDHEAGDRRAVDALAARLDLAILGSSDYHGRGKPNRIGENLSDPAIIDEIIARGAKEVVHP